MKRVLITLIFVVTGLAIAPWASAQRDAGEVQEILIKVQTKDGPKWYKLGKDLVPVPLKVGDYVGFDYTDDTIEQIESGSPAQSQGTTQEPSQNENDN